MDETAEAVAAWKPGVKDFVVLSREDWVRIETVVSSAGLAVALAGVELLPVEIFVEEDDPVEYPEEGCTRCHCGAKYWDGLRCVSCGEIWDGIDHS